MLEKYRIDFFAQYGRKFSFREWKNWWSDFLFWGRLYEEVKHPLVRLIVNRRCRTLMYKRGHEFPFNGSMGEGLVLGHGFGITVNSGAKIGRYNVLFKGCTIGSIRSGKRAGAPKLGDRVVVGCNAFVCGGITIGNDVLIAANSFVDFDVPSNSLVLGNPGIVHVRKNPCRDYLKEGGL